MAPLWNVNPLATEVTMILYASGSAYAFGNFSYDDNIAFDSDLKNAVSFYKGTDPSIRRSVHKFPS